MKNQYRFIKSPKALLNTRLDNIAIVPASLLPFKQIWQKLANRMPHGSILLCHLKTNKPQRKILKRVSRLFEKRGHQVTLISAEGVI